MTETLQRRLTSDNAPLTSANLLDGDARVAGDVLCTCGYNLRTLPAGGLCPECAAPVADTLARYNMPAWLHPVRSALAGLRGIVGLQVGGSALFIVGAGIAVVSEIGAMSGRQRPLGVSVGELICIVALLPLVAAGLTTMFSPILIWMVTADQPSASLRGVRLHVRIAARVLLVVLILGALLSAVTCSSWDSNPGAAAACGTIVGLGLFFPAALARHLAEILRIFDAVRAARNIDRLSFALSLLYPSAWLLFVSFQPLGARWPRSWSLSHGAWRLWRRVYRYWC